MQITCRPCYDDIMDRSTVDKARALVFGCEKLLIITGAGIGAESGLPTFTGKGVVSGIRRLLTLTAAEMGCWYARESARIETSKATRSCAHEMVEFDVPSRRSDSGRTTWIVTTNVDGLHGPDVLEVHGSLHRHVCNGCGLITNVERSAVRRKSECKVCASRLTHDVVSMGGKVRYAEEFQRMYDECDGLLFIGVSGLGGTPAAEMVAEMPGRAVSIDPDRNIPGSIHIQACAGHGLRTLIQ